MFLLRHSDTTDKIMSEINRVLGAASPIESNLPGFTDGYLKEKSGWMANKEYLSWLIKINSRLRSRFDQNEPVTVYYYGIGGGVSNIPLAGWKKWILSARS